MYTVEDRLGSYPELLREEFLRLLGGNGLSGCKRPDARGNLGVKLLLG